MEKAREDASGEKPKGDGVPYQEELQTLLV